MILSDRAIMQARNEGAIILTPFLPENLQPASYDVTLSSELLVYSKYMIPGKVIDGKGSRPPRGEVDLKNLNWLELFTDKATLPEEGLCLRPGQFCLGSTVETIGLNNDLACRFEGKSSLGRIGLFTHVTAGFVDPGFIGTITVELYNANCLPIRLYSGMKIGQLSFTKLTDKCLRPYGSEGLGSKYQNQSGPTPARK